MMRLVAGSLIAAMCCAAPAVARSRETGHQDGGKVAERVVTAGYTQRIASFMSVDPSCESMGEAALNIIKKPKYGYLNTMQMTAFPGFARGNPRYKCNTKRIPAIILTYKAQSDYAGTDTFEIEFVDAMGIAHLERFRITVRSSVDRL